MNTILRSSLTLGLSACLAIAGLTIVNAVTRERIQKAQHQFLMQELNAVLPQGEFDNDPLSSAHLVDTAELGTLTVYPVYRNNTPLAAVLSTTATGGYNGDIKLLVGLSVSGSVIGVRAIKHRETPGLGDAIEIRRSDWIRQFESRSLQTSFDHWSITQRGGDFDAMTGASITSNAVIDAVRDAILWYVDNLDQVFNRDDPTSVQINS